jgi:hypothetical protein
LSKWAIDELKTSTFADEELEEFVAYVVAKADLPFALGARVNRLTPVGRLDLTGKTVGRSSTCKRYSMEGVIVFFILFFNCILAKLTDTPTKLLE